MIVCGLFVFFVSLNVYSQSGQKFCVDGNNLYANDRVGSNNYADLNIYTNSQKRATFTKDGLFDVLGQSRFRQKSIFDSLLTAFSIRTQSLQTDALTVINNGQIGGILTIGTTLTFDGTNNKIISSTGVIDFSNNNLTTTGNINATNIFNLQSTVDSQQTEIDTLQSTVIGIQSSVSSQQVEIDTLQSTVGNIQSSQWQNNGSDIFYNFGRVGVGTNAPAAKLDVWGSQRITENLFVGGELIVSDKFSAKTVTTDTAVATKQLLVNHNLLLGRDIGSVKSDIASKVEVLKIQSDPAAIYDVAISADNSSKVGIGTKFPAEKLSVDGNVSVSGNVTATGTFQANSISTTNITISDKITTRSAEFDTLKVVERFKVEKYIQSDTIHALKRLEVNNSLKIAKEDANNFAEVSTNDTAVTLVLQKEEAAQVVIGPAPVTPVPTLPGQVKDKLTVIGNTRLQGDANVSGTVTANTLSASNMNVSGTTTMEKISTKRIVSPDSIIAFGDSSIYIDYGQNRIRWTSPTSYNWKGLTICPAKGGSFAYGSRSIAIGYYVGTLQTAEKSIVIGSGIMSNPLVNKFPNSLMIGFNSTIPAFFVGSADEETSGKIGIGIWGNDVTSKLHIRADGNTSGTSSLNIINSDDNSMLFVRDDGNVGIGTKNPGQKLQVDKGNILVRGTNNFSSSGNEAIMYFGDTNHYIKSINDSGLRLGTFDAADAISIQQGSGNVGISNPNPYAKLDIYAQCRKGGGEGAACPTPAIIVRDSAGSAGLNNVNFLVYSDGFVYARDIHIMQASTTFPDYVFKKDYRLMTLGEVENYIKKNNHLPDVPSANEIKENGYKLTDMDAILLKKIEEITLYVIELKKENNVLKEKVKKLENFQSIK